MSGYIFDIQESNSLSLSLSQSFAVGLRGSFLDDWEVSPNDVTMEKYIGEGSYGEVYKGSFTRRVHKKEDENMVALVKYLRSKFLLVCVKAISHT